MPIGSYKLTKQRLGRGSFANVTISLEQGDTLKNNLLDSYEKNSFDYFAIKGAQDSLQYASNKKDWVVKDIVDSSFTTVDTDKTSAWCAGAMAALIAIGFKKDELTIDCEGQEDKWSVILPNGEYIRMD